MTRISRALVFLVPVTLAPCLAHAGLTVWRDKNQNGPSQQVDHAVPDLRKMSLDDQISSLSADEPWLVCSEPRYKGECRLIEGTVDNLHGSGMNDRISSARPAPQGRAKGWEQRYPRLGVPSNAAPDDSTPHAAIRVFEHEDYRGTSQVFDRPIGNLANFGLANQITSVQIEGGDWEACSAANFGGQCVVLRGNEDDLEGWSDRIVSLRPVGSPNPWQPPPSSTRSSIRVFEHENYRGTSQVFDRPIGNLANFGLANQITSVQIEGGDWQACNAANFGGECMVLRGNEDDLQGWSDRIVSLRPVGSPNPWPSPPSTTRSSIRVFEHQDYAGTSQVFDRPIGNLANFGLANRITSVQIAGGEWQACTAANYGGQCVVLRGNDDDLGNWSDRIVSLRPVGSQSASQPPPVRTGSHILLFTDRDFGGQSGTFYQAVPNLGSFGLADQVTSLRVEGGGSWEVCTEPGYQGECKVFRDSDQFLGRWSDTIASLRPVPDEER